MAQSHDLVNSLFTGELVRPVMTNPLECFVTCWCVANSNDTSQWTLDIRDNLLEDLIKYAEKLGCSSAEHQHGSIIELKIAPGVKDLTDPPKTLASLPLFLPCLKYLSIVSPMDMAPLLSNLHKLIALDFIAVDCDVTEDITHLPPQHCPSLSTVVINTGNSQIASYIFPSIVFPNMNTITSIKSIISTSTLNVLCNFLCEVTCRLKDLELNIELSTDDAQKLVQALKMNRSLKRLSIGSSSRATYSDGQIILFKFLKEHPTIVYNDLPLYHYSHGGTYVWEDNDLLPSYHPSALARQSEGDTEDCTIANTASEDEDLELALALSLSLETEQKQNSGEEEELGHSMVSIGKELQESTRPEVVLEKEERHGEENEELGHSMANIGKDMQESLSPSVPLGKKRSEEKNPQDVCQTKSSHTASEDEDLELALASSQSLITEEKRMSGEKEELGHSMVSIGKEDQQELMSLSVEEKRSEEKNPQGVCHIRTSNTASEDEDLELALALSLSLATEEKQKSGEEEVELGHSMVSIGKEGEDLQELTSLSVALEEEQRNPQCLSRDNTKNASNTASEDEDLEESSALKIESVNSGSRKTDEK